MIMMLKYLVEYLKLNMKVISKDFIRQKISQVLFLGFDVVVETKSLLAILKFKQFLFR